MSYRVEVSHKHVTILPQPLHDLALVAALKARFPESEGWHHFNYAVGRFARVAGRGARAGRGTARVRPGGVMWIVETRDHRAAPWEFWSSRRTRWLANVLAGWLRAYGFEARVRKEGS